MGTRDKNVLLQGKIWPATLTVWNWPEGAFQAFGAQFRIAYIGNPGHIAGSISRDFSVNGDDFSALCGAWLTSEGSVYTVGRETENSSARSLME
jgi:hypothetical protein